MPFQASNTAVGTAAVRIYTGSAQTLTLVVKNNHASQILYIGDSDVTTTTGFPLSPGQDRILAINDPAGVASGDLWAVASGVGTDCRVLALTRS